MTDWFKVQQNEADRRIELEVYAAKLVEAVEGGNTTEIAICTNMLKEALNTPFDKYKGAE